LPFEPHGRARVDARERVDEISLLREHHRLPVGIRRRDAELDATVPCDGCGKNAMCIGAKCLATALRCRPLPFERAIRAGEIHPLDHESHRHRTMP
jgi:hypothetical protein